MYNHTNSKMCTVKSLLLNSDQDQRKSRPSILNISSLLCPEPEFRPSYNQDINNTGTYQQQQESNQIYRNVPSEVSLWHYKQYHNDNQMLREPYQYHRNNYISSISSSPLSSSDDGEYNPLKTKRRRTSSHQLLALNNVFERTFFPSTQVRVELARQPGMSPRTVQIWFQNKRQAVRSKLRPSPGHQMVE